MTPTIFLLIWMLENLIDVKKILTDKIKQDFRAIRRYTLANFGHDQAVKYSREIQLKIEQLRLRPKIGVNRHEDLGRNIHSCFVGSHTVYYVFDDQEIIFLTILHQSRLPQDRIPSPQTN